MAQETIFAWISKFFFSAKSLVVSKTPAAPSFIPDELPAVTVPSFLKAGFNFLRFSIFKLNLGCSS